MQSIYLVHYGELALKLGHRRQFEERFVSNLVQSCSAVSSVNVTRHFGRVTLSVEDPAADHEAMSRAISRVFGVSWFGRAYCAEATFENLCAITDAVLPEGEFSFGVRTKKAEQTWSRGATETSRDLGAHVVTTRGWKVDLNEPDIWLRVEIASNQVFVTIEKIPGPRGLPVGTSGKVLTLLSGGIDSPVAAYAMMSRGCEIDAVHFHSAPYTSRASQEKVIDLAQVLTQFQPKIRLTMVPIAPVQQEIIQKTPERFRVILYRRFMLRIAERLARRRKILALATGESLGQVASQTLANMHTVDSVCGLPILRPLVGSDKDDIIQMAKKAGTFETSIQPHEDCCSFLMPKKPATTSRPEELEEAEESLDIQALVGSVFEHMQNLRIDCNGIMV